MSQINRASRVAVLTAAAALTAACGQMVTGTPAPDSRALVAVSERLYSTHKAVINKYVGSAAQFRATYYLYGSYAGKAIGNEYDVSFRKELDGQDAMIMKWRNTRNPGAEYDIFVPRGSDREYQRLGPKFTSVAPTPWISLPAAKSDFVCGTQGLIDLCKLGAAIESTAGANPPGSRKEGTTLPDGTIELRLNVTLKALLAERIVPTPDDASTQFTPEMMGKLFDATITVNGDGTLRKVEIIGEVTGKTARLQVQTGYEHKGPATTQDFPATPKPEEVTALDRPAGDEVRKKIAALSVK